MRQIVSVVGLGATEARYWYEEEEPCAHVASPSGMGAVRGPRGNGGGSGPRLDDQCDDRQLDHRQRQLGGHRLQSTTTSIPRVSVH
jgi:hypothetical protein